MSMSVRRDIWGPCPAVTFAISARSLPLQEGARRRRWVLPMFMSFSEVAVAENLGGLGIFQCVSSWGLGQLIKQTELAYWATEEDSSRLGSEGLRLDISRRFFKTTFGGF